MYAYVVVFALWALELRRKRFAGELVLLLACIESAVATVSRQPLIVSLGVCVYLTVPHSRGAGGGCNLQASISAVRRPPSALWAGEQLQEL